MPQLIVRSLGGGPVRVEFDDADATAVWQLTVPPDSTVVVGHVGNDHGAGGLPFARSPHRHGGAGARKRREERRRHIEPPPENKLERPLTSPRSDVSGAAAPERDRKWKRQCSRDSGISWTRTQRRDGAAADSLSATESPAAEPPAAESPAAESPAAESPALEPPALEPLAPEAPRSAADDSGAAGRPASATANTVSWTCGLSAVLAEYHSAEAVPLMLQSILGPRGDAVAHECET